MHAAVAMVQKFMVEMPKHTGRTLPQWIELVKDAPMRSPKERAAWLQTEHKLGPAYASWIAERAESLPRTDFAWEDDEQYLAEAEEYVETMYAGKKSHLRPIFQALLRHGQALGEDVKVCPCQTMVPFYRKHVFAQVKPTTLTRIDLGLCLRGVPFDDRLLDTGGTAKKDRITHRIELRDSAEIDGEVLDWLRRAYEAAG